jgi:chloramphenicol O-acetyltransferase
MHLCMFLTTTQQLWYVLPALTYIATRDIDNQVHCFIYIYEATKFIHIYKTLRLKQQNDHMNIHDKRCLNRGKKKKKKKEEAK